MVGRTARASAKSKAYRDTKYARHGKPTTKSRGDRDKWSIDLESILEMSEDKLYRRCIRDKILDNKKGKLCPHCCKGLAKRNQQMHAC